MIPICEQLNRLKDLRIQRDRSAYRYYNRENQTLLLNLIVNELKTIDRCQLSEELLIQLSNPHRLAMKDIGDLCLIYKKLIVVTKY